MNEQAVRAILQERNAKLVTATKDISSGTRELRRFWEVRDDRLIEECLEFLSAYTSAKNDQPAATVREPATDRETFDGLWRHVSCVASKQPGQFGVIQDLREVFQVASTSDLKKLPFQKRHERERLGLFGLEEGTGYSLIVRVGNLAPTAENRRFLLTVVTDEELSTLYGETGYTVAGRVWDDTEQRGCAVFTVVFRRADWSATWQNDKQIQEERSPGGFRRAQVHAATGVSKDEALSTFSPDKMPADTGFTLEAISLVERAMGEYVLQRVQSAVFDGTTADDALIVTVRRPVGRARGSIERVWYRRTKQAKDTLVGDGGEAVSDYAGYKHAGYEVTDHGDGAYTVSQTLVDLSDSDTLPDVDIFQWMEYGIVGVNYRSTPTDGSESTMQISYHLRRIERLFTNSKIKAYMWANLDADDGEVTWEGGTIDASTVALLENMGDSGKYRIVWGKFQYRENRNPTRYEAWRCTMDFWTDRQGVKAWATSNPYPPGNSGPDRSVRTGLPPSVP